MVEKYQRDLSETQAALYEEGQTRNKLQMELDSKDSEIEMLQQKLSVTQLDTASVHSGSLEDGEISLHNSSISSPGKGKHGNYLSKYFIVWEVKVEVFYMLLYLILIRTIMFESVFKKIDFSHC